MTAADGHTKTRNSAERSAVMITSWPMIMMMMATAVSWPPAVLMNSCYLAAKVDVITALRWDLVAAVKWVGGQMVVS